MAFVRTTLLIGAVLAVAVSPVRAQDTAKPAPPKMRTITVTECVPEKYTVEKTVHKWECKRVEYDSVRCETVCEPRVREVTVVKRVPVMKTETRKVCCNEVTWVDKTVMKKCWEYKQVTCMEKKCVSKGHWECRTECARQGFLDRVCHRRDCADDPCAPCAPKTVTRKVWVNCPVYKDCPVTRCQRVCVEKPVTCKVKVCKPVMKEVQVQVCTYRCEEQKVKQTYYERVTRQVPCKAVKYERVCVPTKVQVTCCRMVERTREIQVPDVPCEPCGRARCHGLRLRAHRDDCCH